MKIWYVKTIMWISPKIYQLMDRLWVSCFNLRIIWWCKIRTVLLEDHLMKGRGNHFLIVIYRINLIIYFQILIFPKKVKIGLFRSMMLVMFVSVWRAVVKEKSVLVFTMKMGNVQTLFVVRSVFSWREKSSSHKKKVKERIIKWVRMIINHAHVKRQSVIKNIVLVLQLVKSVPICVHVMSVQIVTILNISHLMT